MIILKRLIAAILHFFEHKQNHAFHVHFDGRVYHICARCSGLYLGVILGLPIMWILFLIAPLFIYFGDFLTTLICLGIALPTIIDWTTQRLALRESSNPTRFITAFLAGFTMAWYLISSVSLFIKIFVLFGVFVFISIFSLIDRRPEPENQDAQDAQEISSQ